MASPDHAAKRPATALIRAFLDMPSEDRFQTVMEDPSTLDALLIEADALVAALAQAEQDRDEAIEALRAIHTSPTCFIDCTEHVGAVLATLNPHAA